MLNQDNIDKGAIVPAHESAELHVSGEASYVDDKLVSNQLFGGVYYSPHARARILNVDLEKAKRVEGVRAVLSYQDIPGHNDMGPIVNDEPILAQSEVNFVGQAIFLVAAETETALRQALGAIDVSFEILEPVLSIEDAMVVNSLLAPPRFIRRGNVDKAFKESRHVLSGELRTGAQEHWYLETQICLTVPEEADELVVYSGTQHPAETQALIAEALAISSSQVKVEVRRMGGAFGGKETQGNHVAVWASLLAQACGRPVKFRLSRNDDQKITGKRHPFLTRYKVGFDDKGILNALDLELNSNAGAATDLSMAVLERAMMHSDNSYYLPNVRISGRAWKTNLPSNTAFRGFGAPQGIAGIEAVMDAVSRYLGVDSQLLRQRNFYGVFERNLTPYGQAVEHNRLPAIYHELMMSSDYLGRRAAIEAFNKENEFEKKGMALTPVKFGIAFTTSFLNQAGALVNIYKDGTVLVNHGGVEMGQGLHSKIRLIAALELGLDIEAVKVNATDTSKVPNASATAASSGTDLNGMAVKQAILELKSRIVPAVAAEFNGKLGLAEARSRSQDLMFIGGFIVDRSHPQRRLSFKDAASLCHFKQLSLSAAGFYKMPALHFDRDKGVGRPYHYMAFGMAVTEIKLDVLTGRHEILRTDIVHDVGESINPRLDIGQIEGAFIQGVGWCTTEECKWDDKGKLLNHSPDTYKIPGIRDIPKVFNVKLLQGAPNPNNIRKSKAVGEPPFVHGLSCWLAIKDAVSAVTDHLYEPELNIPATQEAILLSIDKLHAQQSARSLAGDLNETTEAA